MEAKAVSIKSAAQLLSVSPATVRACILRGELPTCRVGRRVLIPMHAIDALVSGARDEREA
jgi:excisionase family DNA binding protein